MSSPDVYPTVVWDGGRFVCEDCGEPVPDYPALCWCGKPPLPDPDPNLIPEGDTQ